MLVKNLQQNIHNCQQITYILGMSAYSPKVFAKWLNDAYQKSSFKSLSELADAVNLSRATVSSYASARPQTVSNKPSRPKRENVIRLAEALNTDIDEALLVAGHAPTTINESHEILKGVSIQFDRSVRLTQKDKDKILDAVRLITAGVKAEQEDVARRSDRYEDGDIIEIRDQPLYSLPNIPKSESESDKAK